MLYVTKFQLEINRNIYLDYLLFITFINFYQAPIVKITKVPRAWVHKMHLDHSARDFGNMAPTKVYLLLVKHIHSVIQVENKGSWEKYLWLQNFIHRNHLSTDIDVADMNGI